MKLAEHQLDARLEWEVTVKDKGFDAAKKKIEQLLGVPATPWQRVADAGARGYGTSLIQDNYWCVTPEAPVWWFVDGESWTNELIAALEQCLIRMTYFGRAETLTRIRVADSQKVIPSPNCTLVDKRIAGGAPVLTPLDSATRDDIERITDNPESVGRDVPHGARFLYAVRPQSLATRERRRAPVNRPDCHLVQFALGWNVAPDPRVIVRLTSRFRGAVLRELLRLKTGDASATWTRVGREVRESIADMAGKSANNEPLKGHRHTEFLAWCRDDQPTRLVVWRGSHAFDDDEQEAILLAASRDVSWAAGGSDANEWKVRLIPLDRDVPAPPGFDGQASVVWESVTPYVPPRHHLRGGREREGESMTEQISRELERRGLTEQVEVELVGTPAWVSVHVPRREADKRAFIGDRRGQAVRLRFAVPVTGQYAWVTQAASAWDSFAPFRSGTSRDHSPQGVKRCGQTYRLGSRSFSHRLSIAGASRKGARRTSPGRALRAARTVEAQSCRGSRIRRARHRAAFQDCRARGGQKQPRWCQGRAARRTSAR